MTPLSATQIRACLSAGNADFEVVVLPETDSTNVQAARLCTTPFTRKLVLAERQTAGRGRLGRSFYSPQGGLYMTALLPFSLKPVTIAAGVAVAEAIEAVSGQTAAVKWVNDVYMFGKKVCGILAEAVAGKYIAVGIGVNLSAESFPAELERAGGIGQVDRNRLAAEIVNRLTVYIDRPDIVDAYRARCFTVGQTVSYTLHGVTFTAEAVGIDEHGGLILSNGEVLTTGGLNN